MGSQAPEGKFIPGFGGSKVGLSAAQWPWPKPEPEMVLQHAGRSIDLGIGAENTDLDGYAGPEPKKESGA